MARSSKARGLVRTHHRRRKRSAANCTGSGQNSPAARSWRRFEQLEDRCLLSLVSGLAPASLYLPSQHDLWVPQGYLTGPTPGQPLQLAMSYLTAHAADLGVTPADIQSSIVTDQYFSPEIGLTHIYLRQEFSGIEIANANLNVNVDSDGRILSVGGAFVPCAPAADKGSSLDAAPHPKLDAPAALRSAAQALHLNAAGTIVETGPSDAAMPTMATTLSDQALSLDPIPAKLQYVATPAGLRLTWDMVLRTPDRSHWYDVNVDSSGGEILAASDWTDYASYNVFALPTESPSDGSRTIVVDPADATASPNGWHDIDPPPGDEYTDTEGNNVLASANGNYPDGGTALNFDFPLNLTQAPSTYDSAATTNLFYWVNMLHDLHYHYGFTEVAGNFQQTNYTSQGLGNDPVLAFAQDPAASNNAFMGTPPDGQSPQLSMGVFSLTTPNRDSDLESVISTHEFGHGVSNRLVGGPSNANALSAYQSGGMGEGWSDWWGLMFTQKPSDTKLAAYPVGTYVLGQPLDGPGIRRHPYSFDLTIDPLTYADYNTSPEVHDAGEIWCSTLWDLNWLLIDKYGYSSNIAAGYTGPGSAGNILALQLVEDSLKIMPVLPTFLNGRDAMLQADEALTGGANQQEIWTAFARRGMGFSAYDGGNANATTVEAAFDLPVFKVVSQTPSGVSLTPISAIDFRFGKDLNPSSFSVAADVQSFTDPNGVNLVPQITGPSFPSAKTLRLTFSPQSVEGLYTIVIGPQILAADGSGAMDQDGDGTHGEPVDDQYTGTFRYDALLMNVSSTLPANGATLTTSLPTTAFRVTFNEPYAPGSIGNDDLTLSQGSVVGHQVVSPTTVEYALSGVSSETPLVVTLAAGAVTDTHGNPSGAYSGTYPVEITTTTFPTLVSENPSGSLMYDGSTTASIGTAGDTDSFAIDLAAGQALTAAVVPAAALQPTFTLTGPGGFSVGPLTAAAAGKEIFVQSIPVGAAGTYTVTVGSAAGTTGQYTLQLLLNAAVEEEAHGGATNNDFASAQALDGAFLSLGGALERAAIMGVTDPRQVFGSWNMDTNPGWPTTTGGQWAWGQPTGQGGANYGYPDPAAGHTGSNVYGVNLSGNYSTAIGGPYYLTTTALNCTGKTNVQLSFWRWLNTDYVPYVTQTVDVSNDAIHWANVYTNPVGTEVAENSWHLVQYDLHAVADNQPTVYVRWGHRINMSGAWAYSGWNIDDVSLAGTAQGGDDYSFTLAAGESTTVALTSLATDSVTLELYDSSYNLLAKGATAGNISQVINNFVSTAGGTYYLRIVGIGAPYSLVVTRNADVDTEMNNTMATAQDIGATRTILGAVRAPDLYYLWDNVNSELDTVTTTASATALGPAGVSSITGLAYDTSHRILYGSDTSDHLFRFDTATGAATSLGTLSLPISSALAYNPLDGLLYSTNSFGALVQINPTTLSAAVVSGAGPGIGAAGMAYDPTDQRIYAYSNGATRVYSYDAGTYSGPTVHAAPTRWPNYGLTYNGSSLVLGPGATAGGTFYAYNPLTGACTALFPSTLLGNIELSDFVFASGYDEDYYHIHVHAGDTLLIGTQTPGDGPNQFVNLLDPRIELYGPSGNLVASDDNGAADHRNALLTYAATVTGTYTVGVFAAAQRGEYVLSVQGATGGLPPFAVSATTPADGKHLAAPPAAFTVNFNDFALETSVQTADLLIDGVPDSSATPPRFADGKTVVFTLPAGLTEGTHQAAINAAAIVDLQNTPVQAFTGTFVIDLTGPRLVTSSLSEADLAPTGNLTYTATFDEDMDSTVLDASDFSLVGGSSGSHAPGGFAWTDPRTLQLQFSNLAEDGYTLTLKSGAGKFQDLAGNALDGEPHTPFSLPSGDGLPGGDFVVHFSADIVIAPFPTPLVGENPSGSLIYDGSTSAMIGSGSDTDSFTIALDAGQTLTAVAVPATALQPTLTVTGPGGVNVGPVTAATAGKQVFVQTVPVATAGTYTVTVGSAAGTTGQYTLQLALNAAVEEEDHDGGDNSTPPGQNLDGSFLALTAKAGRAAVLGVSDHVNALASESEPNNTTATANDARENFAAYSGNLYHLGLTGTIATSGETDWYNIGALDVGDLITISQSGSPSSRGTLDNPRVYLYRYNVGPSTPVTSDNNNGPGNDALIYRYSIATADTYYVSARGANSTTGTYALGLWLENTGSAPSTGGTCTSETEPIISMATANDASTSWRAAQYVSHTAAAVTAGDVDYYKFQFTAGDLVSVNLHATSTPTWRPRVTLVDSAGTTLALEDGTSTGPTVDSFVYCFIVPATGIYYVQAQAQSGTATGAYNADVYLSTATPPPSPSGVVDYYHVTLAAGDTVNAGLKLSSAGAAHFALQDPGSSNWIAGVSGASNWDETLGNYAAPAAGAYVLRVTSATGANAANYALVVVRNAALDVEPNNALSSPEDIAATRTVVGAVGDDDCFSFSVAASEHLALYTKTPAGGPNEFVNNLDPMLTLYDSGGTLLGSDDNGALDQRNAALPYTFATAGVYKARVSAANATSGEYVLAIDSVPSATVTPTSGLVTTENGGTAQFTVVLDAQPTANVVINLWSSDTSEGTISPASLTFMPGNWGTPQTVTVTGVLDFLADGNVPYTIETLPAISDDTRYNNMNAADVSVVNLEYVPVTRTWNGGGADNHWTTPANWVGGQAPGPGDALVFPAGAAQLVNANNYPAGTTFGSITLAASNCSLSGSALVLSGGLTISASPSGQDVVYANLTFTAATATIENTGTTVLDGAIASNGTVRVLGTGTLTIAGPQHWGAGAMLQFGSETGGAAEIALPPSESTAAQIGRSADSAAETSLLHSESGPQQQATVQPPRTASVVLATKGDDKTGASGVVQRDVSVGCGGPLLAADLPASTPAGAADAALAPAAQRERWWELEWQVALERLTHERRTSQQQEPSLKAVDLVLAGYDW